MKPINIICMLIALSWQSCSIAPSQAPKLSNRDWGKIMVAPSKDENQHFKSLWQSKKPIHFHFKLRLGCTCANNTLPDLPENLIISGSRWLDIEIKNEKIVAVHNIDGTINRTYGDRTNFEDPINVGFYMLEGDIKNGFEKLWVIYDENLGFPRYILNSGEKGPTDIGFQFEIVEFEKLD